MTGSPTSTAPSGLRKGGDALESAGIARAREQLNAADLVVLVFDASRPWISEDVKLARRWPQAVMTYNKCDLPTNRGDRPPQSLPPQPPRPAIPPGDRSPQPASAH